MRLIFLVDDVLPHINQCASVANAKNSISILQNLLIESNSGKDGLPLILITGSDNETWLQTNACVESFDENFSICVNANDFNKALSNLKGKRIEMDIDTQKHIIKCCHDNGHFQLPCFDSEEYPRPIDVRNEQDIVSKKISSSSLLLALNKVSFATANDELRPVMNGIYFDLTPDSLSIVASDGHKLVRNQNFTIKNDIPASFVLPKKPATLLKNVLSKDEGDVTIKFNDRNAEIIFTDGTLNCRLIEGRYPNYNSVIPKDNPNHVTIDRKSLLSAIRRVLPFASESSQLVRFHLEMCKLEVSSQDLDFATAAKEHLTCEYTNKPMSIGFKGSSLLEILNNIDSEEVVLQLADPSRAGIIVPATQPENEDVLMLIMPMLLND